MVTDRVIGASDVGKTFAETIRDDRDVLGIWARRHRDVFEIWVLTEPIEPEHERTLYEAVGVLHDAFPYALIHVYLINLRNHEDWDRDDVLLESIPPNAELMYSRKE